MNVTMAWSCVGDVESEPFKAIQKELYDLEKAVPTKRHDSQHWSRAWEYPWAILNSGVKQGDAILNAGSGTDVLGFYLSRYGYTTNLDRDPDVINDGISQAKGKFPRLLFRVADIAYLPYEDEWFDKMFCISVLEHGSASPRTYLDELLRVLKTGGTLIATVDVGPRGISPADAEALFWGLPPAPARTLVLYPSREDFDRPERGLLVLGAKVVKT